MLPYEMRTVYFSRDGQAVPYSYSRSVLDWKTLAIEAKRGHQLHFEKAPALAPIAS